MENPYPKGTFNYCAWQKGYEAALSPSEESICAFCPQPPNGPMFFQGGLLAHADCVIRELNKLLDPDFDGVSEPTRMVGYLSHVVSVEEIRTCIRNWMNQNPQHDAGYLEAPLSESDVRSLTQRIHALGIRPRLDREWLINALRDKRIPLPNGQEFYFANDGLAEAVTDAILAKLEAKE